MATEIWVNIGSGNGLVPSGNKPLHWTNVDLSSVRSSDIHLSASSREISQPSITEIIWKIEYLKFHLNFPGVNELTTAWHYTGKRTLPEILLSHDPVHKCFYDTEPQIIKENDYFFMYDLVNMPYQYVYYGRFCYALE